MISGYFNPPEGWQENSPIFKGSTIGYRVLWLCHKYLTPRYREYIDRARSGKSVYHIISTEQISQFVAAIENETNFEKGATA
ncbi:hypothetical protein [Microcoleus sp. S13_C5]|uniref:hypothetical protein n=1 Tax=Microcoleus sp. S13_C5 TaxID=3055411 RepID=UPI002FD3F7A3